MRPLLVEAREWTGENTTEITSWVGVNRAYTTNGGDMLFIRTDEGVERVHPGNLVVKDQQTDRFSAWDAKEFARTFEEVH